jgi:SAM-dependent methyltransferase
LASRPARPSSLGERLFSRFDRSAAALWYCRLFRRAETFSFRGRPYRYFFHAYHTTWRNERAVEIPIVWDRVRRHAGGPVLELGNVLGHYFPVSHDRVDKYERAPGVLNEDIVGFRPGKRYDLVVSISTLEHVGWDEEPRDPEKSLRAIETLRRLAAPGGLVLATVPLAYNPHLDARLRKGDVPFSRRDCLKRVSRTNRWAEVEWREIEHSEYDAPFRRINGLVVLEFTPAP